MDATSTEPTDPGAQASGDDPIWRDDQRRDRRRRIGGCLGCGGLGIAGTAIALAVVLGSLSSSLDGCDIDVSSNPGEGTASARLGVLVAPATGLTDGDVVTVASDAFAPNTIVGVAVCRAEAVRLGVEACDEAQGARFATDGEGRLAATYAVPRVIAIDGDVHDCASSAGSCVLVAADANDYDRSGGQPLSFDASAPAPLLERPGERPQTDRLPATAAPAGPVAPGTAVVLEASGFQPGEPVLAAWCTEQFADEGPSECEPLDSSAAFAAVAFRSLSGIEPGDLHADADGRVRAEVPARATIAPAIAVTGGDTGRPVRPDGRVDCRTAPGACWFVLAAAADTKRSAVVPYEVTPR